MRQIGLGETSPLPKLPDPMPQCNAKSRLHGCMVVQFSGSEYFSKISFNGPELFFRMTGRNAGSTNREIARMANGDRTVRRECTGIETHEGRFGARRWCRFCPPFAGKVPSTRRPCRPCLAAASNAVVYLVDGKLVWSWESSNLAETSRAGRIVRGRPPKRDWVGAHSCRPNKR